MRRPKSQATKTLQARYRWFKANMDVYIVGRSAAQAMALAKAEEKAEELGLAVDWDYEVIPWDADCPPPEVHAWACVKVDGRVLASLGSIGLTSWRDPYMRTVEAELFQEALAYLDDEAAAEARELAQRATFAG